MGKQQKIKEQRKLEKNEQEKVNKRKTGRISLAVFIILAVGIAGFLGYQYFFNLKNNKDMKIEQTENPIVVLETNKGAIKIKLFKDRAPKTVENFIKLTNQNFYDGVKFHRVIKDFMIQAGDPNSKDSDWTDDGTGGPGYKFDDEINDVKLTEGKVAMANSGPNTNGSQFFIVTVESAPWLDGKHTVFGEVIEGLDVVTAIENVNTDKDKNDHPVEDVVINKITIL